MFNFRPISKDNQKLVHNQITNKNINTRALEYEHISWVDSYVIEDGKWKIGAAHAIDYRLELPVIK